MSTDYSGLDELRNKLSDIAKRAKKLEGTHKVSFNKLFTEPFMRKHTNVSSFEDFLEAGNFIVNSPDDFAAIPDDVFDNYVSEATDFDSWEDMKSAAGEEYVRKELGF